jgi:hypothetical protein
MSIEAFVWRYENGEPAAFQFDDVLNAFGEAVVGWNPESGSLQLEYGGPAETCEITCDKDAAETGEVRGLLISRPVRAAALWQSVLRILSENHAILFFSDDTTPLVWDLQSVAHFPQDLIAELGSPKQVRTPEEILEHAGR